jgi:hypothetical protein
VGNFRQVEVAGPYDVSVRTGGNPGVSGSGPEKLLERTVVEVRGDKLIIHPEKTHSFFHWGRSLHGKASFAVTVPELDGAAIAGSGDLQVDRISGQQFEGEVAGSGALSLGTVQVQSLKLGIAGSGSARASVGKAQSARYDIAGSGDIDAQAVQTEELKVSIAGSGGVKAHSSGTAKVNIMGSGDVAVAGGAKCSISKTGSGSVSCS